MSTRVLGALCLSIVLCVAARSNGEQVKCACVADVAISHGQGEEDASGGRMDRLKLKIHQEFALLDFDLAALRGRKVVAADLYLFPLPERADFAGDRLTPLRWLQISTVSSRWREGEQDKAYEPDPTGHGATFREAAYRQQAWAWPDSTVAHVINGHSNSLYCANELRPAADGYWKVGVDPQLIRLLLAGGGHGLSVIDASGTWRANSFIASRESRGREPYLLVTVAGQDTEAPEAPAGVKAVAAPEGALAEHGAMAVELAAPAEVVAYAVRVDGKALEPWQVSRPGKPGVPQRIVIQDLPADREAAVEVAAVDGAGNRSKAVKVKGRTSKTASVPTLPGVQFQPQPGEPLKVDEHLRVWAFPEVDKVDPQTGRLLFGEGKGFERANPVWSGKERLIRIAAARGEIASFQLALQTDGQAVEASVVPGEIKGPDGARIDRGGVRLFRAWYVKAGEQWHAEYAIPYHRSPGVDESPYSLVQGPLHIPARDNVVPDQKLQALYVDIPVPKDAVPGEYAATVRVVTEGGAADLALRLVVYPAVIPDELSFIPELNAYGAPAEVGTQAFFDYHRLAHYSRCTLNILPYIQDGSVFQEMVPKVEGKGADVRVTDWAPYDRAVGPLLDGSAFEGLPRDRVPVRCLYLPLFENWPLRLGDHYKPGVIFDPMKLEGSPATQQESFPGAADRRMEKYDAELQQRKEKHDLTAPRIQEAFDEAYANGNASIARQFVEHFAKKGWTRSEAQIYLNNKYNWGATWWLLDEPMEYTDFAALAYFSSIYHKALDRQKGTHLVFRGDISRPEWMGSTLDGLIEAIYFNSGSTGQDRLARQLEERMPVAVRIYGACNGVDRNNFESAAWCLSSFGTGASGVLPWQSLGTKQSLTKPDALALLVPGDRFGVTAVASTRVLALRHGAQQCELLRLLMQKRGWTLAHAQLLITQKVPLRGLYRERFLDEAAAVQYARLSSENFLALKEGLLQLLAEKGQSAASQPASGH